MTTPDASPEPVVDLAAVTEDVDAHMLLGPGEERVILPDAVIVRRVSPHPHANTVGRLRFGASLEPRVDAIRAWFAEHDRARFLWCIGWHATPVDLEARLLDLGAVPDPSDHRLTALILDHEPPPAPTGIEIRRETTREQFLARTLLSMDVCGIDDADRAMLLARTDERWAALQANPNEWAYGAYLDGELVAMGVVERTDVGPLFLGGGATRPDARGRGIYRALVRARWDDAVRLGTPALLVHASPMSRPILERSGFRSVGAITLLEDRSAPH